MRKFDTVYIDTLRLLHESNLRRVGFFPGCFSPPHKGHYMTAKKMSVENDVSFIIASDTCRDENVTTEKMAAIWKIYIQAMGVDNVHVKVVPGSPVGVTYQAVNLLNNSGKLISSKPIETHPDAQDIYDRSKSDHIQIALYAGQEDFAGRYSAFLKGNEPYKGDKVTDIIGRQVDRYASGTETRQAIHDIAIGVKDADTLRNLLPGPSAGNEFTGVGFLNAEQEDQVVNILLS